MCFIRHEGESTRIHSFQEGGSETKQQGGGGTVQVIKQLYKPKQSNLLWRKWLLHYSVKIAEFFSALQNLHISCCK